MTSHPSRIPPLPVEEFTEEQAQLVGPWKTLAFSRVLVRHPDMYRTFVPFLAELIARTRLPPRDREIVCLRSLRLCGDTYEHTHHVEIARRTGMTDEEITAATEGKGAALTDFDRTVVRATEELVRDQYVSDRTWKELEARYSQQQRMEIVFLTGCYVTMAMLTKTFGMRLDEDASMDEINANRTYT